MSSRLLPASPNWYCSKVSDANEKTFVFGARQTVCVYGFDSSRAGRLQHVWTFTEHRERVTAVALCRAAGRLSHCCSADEDGKVKLWDAESREVLREHAEHSSKSGKVTAVSWSPLDGDLVVTGDDKGGVVSWWVGDGRVRAFTPESGQAVVCVSCSTVDVTLLAVGYRSGLILLVSLTRAGQVTHRLRGHDDEVHSLAWCCLPGENIEKNGGPDKDGVDSEDDISGCLLASGCKSRTVGVWSSRRGKLLEMLRLPTNTGTRRDRWDDAGRARIWVTVCWLPDSQSQLISSSHNGDLLKWDVGKPGRNKWELMSPCKESAVAGHSRIVFNLSCGGPADRYLVSVSMDRQVVVWDLPSLAPCFSLASLGGFVYAVESSPVDPGLVAVGVGDNLIRIWRVNDSSAPYSVTSLWQGIKSKVTALSWHPTKEGLLAYGTDDGRVGIHSVFSNKPPQISSTYHRRTVYVVAWGPPCPAIQGGHSPMCVYSVGDGLIKEHLVTKLDAEAVDIHSLIDSTNGKRKQPIRSEIRWRPDFSLVALGNDDGSVEIFRPPDLRLVAVLRLHQKLVNCVRWHPAFTTSSPTTSPCRHLVATGSNENAVYVVDLTQVIEGLSEEQEVVTVTTSSAQLQGHTGRITGLSWSQHADGRLVSASYDGTAQVWDVCSKQPIANFRGHVGKLLCAEWSPLEENMVLTGGDDFCLHLWDISQQTHQTCPPAKRKSKGKGKGRKREQALVVAPPTADSEDGDELPPELRELLDAKRRELLAVEKIRQTEIDESVNAQTSGRTETDVPLDTKTERQTEALLTTESSSHETAMLNVNHDRSLTDVSSMTAEQICGVDVERTQESDDRGANPKSAPVKRVAEPRKRRRPKSTFPLVSARDNSSRSVQLADLMQLVRRVYEPGHVTEVDDAHLGLYLSRRAVYRCLKREGQHHRDHDNMDYYLQLEVWKGNIGGALRFAREREELSDWLVAMAPMASQQMWMDACCDYAHQLEGDGQFHKAASYFLAAHKVYDAVNLFRRHRMFREAVGVAKLRLSPLDPVHEELYSVWGQQLTREGHFEQAAKCYVAIKQVREAARLVARRGDQDSLRAAAHMNFIASENREGLVYAQKVVHSYLLGQAWDEAKEFCGESRQLKAFVLLSCLHEMLLCQLEKMDSQLNVLRTEASPAVPIDCGDSDVASQIPEFIVNVNEADPLSPWQPYLVGKQTFLHSVLRVWCGRYELPMEAETLEGLYRTLQSVHTSQSNQDSPQLLIGVGYELSHALLSLLLGDTPASIRHFVLAVGSLQSAGQGSLLQAVCRLCFPLGPRYVLKLQQEVTALRVLLNIDNTDPFSASSKSHTTHRKFWSEPREEDMVSNSGHRCRELDCLRAYYYLAVLYHLQTARDAEQTNSPEIVREAQQEEKLCEPVQEGSGVSDPSQGGTTLSDPSQGETTLSDPAQKQSSLPHSSPNDSDGGASIKDVYSGEADTVVSALDSDKNHSGSLHDSQCETVDTNPPESRPLDSEQTPVLKSVGLTSCSVRENQVPEPQPHSQPSVCSDVKPLSPASLTLSKLKCLCKSVLWDVQGKRFALTETLGYVHKAMSQLLLTQTASSQRQQPDLKGDLSGQANTPDQHTNGQVLGSSSPTSPEGVTENPQISVPPMLPPDVLLGLPEQSSPVTRADNYVSISDLWKQPSPEMVHPTTQFPSPFPDYVKPKKVLWKDTEPRAGLGIARRRSLELTFAHDSSAGIPSDWYRLPVDQRYTQSYVTQDMLQQEEDFIKGELLRGPDSEQMLFPKPLTSAIVLLDVCERSLLCPEEKAWLRDKLTEWALFFSVTSPDRELFRSLQKKAEGDSAKG